VAFAIALKERTMANESTKVIVSNLGVLKSLYGKRLDEEVTAALNRLVEADGRRGLTTRIVYLDDVAQMEAVGAPPVTNPANDAQNKAAIDGIFTALKPDYLAILGAPDIVPMQKLDNPLNDADRNVPSDLPYACAGQYSVQIRDFLDPTRLVGRIPGVMGSPDPTALVAALDTAATVQAVESFNYTERYFGISAAVWQGSSTTSVNHIFGNADHLWLSPPYGPNWTDDQLQRLAHFVNCHGASNDPKWYGQSGASYPIALLSSSLPGKISKGTIVAAECCYGAQLYDPAGLIQPICNAYLANGAAAFCGSTTIAYGPAEGQGQADLITQFFLIQSWTGVTSGRAMLDARLQFTRQVVPLGPSDLKTLAQFNLLGDPSCRPVISALHPDASQPSTERNGQPSRSPSWLEAVESPAKSSDMDGALAELARNAGLKTWTCIEYVEKGGTEALDVGTEHFVLFGRLPDGMPLPRYVLVSVRANAGKVVQAQVQYSKT
jgi:hypothetical protein